MKLISGVLSLSRCFVLAGGVAICCHTADMPAKYSDVAAMRAQEAKEGLPITSFFSGDGKSGPDGQLIRSEPASEYELPKGAHATRILYRSHDLRGAPTTASATVVTPAGRRRLGDGRCWSGRMAPPASLASALHRPRNHWATMFPNWSSRASPSWRSIMPAWEPTTVARSI